MSEPGSPGPPDLKLDPLEGPLSKDDVDRLVMRPTGRRRLGKYVLLGRIGHGGMGKIYLAYAPGPAGIEKLLVVKRLHSHLTGDPVLVSSFLDEARLSMALNHPNIVSTFDVGEVDGRTFMVMEYIDGQNLGVLLRTAKRSGAYPSSALWAGLFCGVLDGLHAAHHAKDARGRSLHIIHRDVSPQNVLVTYDGIPKLVDFGIAKAAMRVSETDAGVLKGKYAYMSPEQLRGEPLDARSDVFAAGVVLWEMLAGRRLYKADSVVRSVERILTEPPVSPQRVNPACDAEIARVAFKALQKDREQRYRSAHEMREALEDALHKQGMRTRHSDVRELMQRLFADVIARQRTVLEAALSADGDAELDEDDGHEPSPNDSESDVSMHDLKHQVREIGETTTPSAVRGSPLVTADAEKRADSDESQTSVERKKRAPPAASAQRVTESMAAFPPEVTKTAKQPEQQRSRAALGAIAVLLLTIVLTVVAWRVFDSGPDAAQTPPPAAVDVAAVPDAVVDVVADVVEDVDAGPAPAAAVDAGPAVDGGPPVDAAPPVVEESKPPVPEPRAARTDRVRRPAPEGRPPRAPVADPEPAAPAPATSPAVAAPPDAPTEKIGGFLSLDTVPWTIVYLGTRKLGETPLVNVPVPAGALELLLVNSDAGIKEAYIARVKPGETFRQRLDLQ